MTDLTHDEIRAAAEEITQAGDEDLQDDIEGLLVTDNLRSARIRLLAYVDGMVDKQRISEQRAAEFYKLIGFSGEEASRIRRNARSKLGSSPKQTH